MARLDPPTTLPQPPPHSNRSCQFTARPTAIAPLATAPLHTSACPTHARLISREAPHTLSDAPDHTQAIAAGENAKKGGKGSFKLLFSGSAVEPYISCSYNAPPPPPSPPPYPPWPAMTPLVECPLGASYILGEAQQWDTNHALPGV